MIGKKISISLLVIFFLATIYFFINSNSFKKVQKNEPNIELTQEEIYSSNILKDVKYTTKDVDGNEYIITALEGEIDYSNSNILYLTGVKAIIKLLNSDNISITSDYGKYNSENFDTIFSKNVMINYLNNNITGEYVDFSLIRNSMLISKKVVYTNLENILKADVIEINIKTKDTKIFMHESKKKVNIQSKN
tara:strand:- start:1022 stop:1597 length:576 start_codon:yes stop_codon:yes gene_type:complete